MANDGTNQGGACEDELRYEAGAPSPADDGPQPSSTDQELLGPPRQRLRRPWRSLSTYFIVLILAASIGIIIFMTQASISIFSVKGNSMVPSLNHGDSIVLRQAKTPARGQIIIFRKPSSWKTSQHYEQFIKRIVAAPGDTLAYDGKNFTVNGEIINTVKPGTCTSAPQHYSTKLNNRQLFVMGDNMEESVDSRRQFCTGNLGNMFVEKRQVIDYGKIIMKF